MKNRHKPLRTLVNAAVIGVLTTGAVHAAGFSLYGEGAGYTAGNYGAGSAAEAADASTGWYNPAGLALLRNQQVVFGGVGVFPSIRVDGTSTYATTLPITPPVTIDYVQKIKREEGGYDAFVPSFHYALPVGEQTTLGLSINAPFGLATNWSPTSPVRYAATYTEIITMDISPELGTRLTENFAVGAGLDFQYARAKFNQIIGAPTLLDTFGENPTALDSLSYNKGSSWGVGFHVGVMGLFNDNHTRVGINYQSRMRHVFHGFSRLSGPFANDDLVLALPPYPTSGLWRNNDLFSNPAEFPEVVTLSGYQDINDRLALLGSVVYTGWDIFKSITLNNIVVPSVNSSTEVSRANINTTIPQNFGNAWRVSLGANYRINPKLMLRVGGGYDQTPTNNTDRNVRLPDVDRWAIAVGAHYQIRPNVGVDLGYTHLFSGSKSTIDSTEPLPPTSSYNTRITGGSFSADLVGAQLTWIIDKAPEAPTK